MITSESVDLMNRYSLTVRPALARGYWDVEYSRAGKWAVAQAKDANEAILGCVMMIRQRRLDMDGYAAGAD